MTQNKSPFIQSQRTISRRTSLAMLGAAIGLGLSSLSEAKSTQSPSLAKLASAKGMRFGSATGAMKGGLNDPAIQVLLIRECNIIVPENELKMYVTHNQADSYDFAPGDAVLAFCKTNHMAMRGHNLIWARDKYTPEWLKAYDFGSNPKVVAERLLRDYIAKVADHYGDQLTSWDVVNETIDPKTGEVTDNVFGRVLGMDALRIAFEATREHLPKMQLVYNDYMSWDVDDEMHRNGVLKLLRWFRENKVPVDALGVQGHIGNKFDISSDQIARWKKFLDEVVAMGYDLLVTEFDVNDKTIESSDFAVRDAKVAEIARLYLDQMLSYKQLKDVLVWGISDKYSWLRGFSKRKDGLPVRPTPYDDEFHPKPLRDAIAASFKAAPHRG